MKISGYFGAAIILLLLGFFMFAYTVLSKNNSGIYRVASSVFESALLIQNSEIGDVYLYLVFPSGEARNPFDEGLAHYVEHLAWLSALQGPQKENNRHSNAWTNQYTTGYWQKTTEGYFQSGLRNLITVAEPLRVETQFALEERKIVLREYEYGFTERPLYPVWLDMDRTIYGAGTLSRSVIGEPSVIEAYSLEDATALHKQSHILSEATLVVYGNVRKARFEAVLESIPASAVQMPGLEGSSNKLVENSSIADKSSLSLVNLAEDTVLYRKLVPYSSCDGPAHCAMVIQIAKNALDSSLPGGIAGPLRFDQFVARSFSFDITRIGNDYVEISFTANPDNGIPLEQLEQAFQDAFRTTLKTGLTQETFERVSARIKGDLTGILERDVPSYNLDLALGQLMANQPMIFLDDQMKSVETVRLEDVNTLLESLLADGREVTRLVAAER